MQKTTSEMNGEQLIRYLKEKQTERVMPFSVTFELTPMCNFRCKMCYIRLDQDQLKASGSMLPAVEWIKIAREAMNAGVYKITFTGGEVFTHPDFQTIYETVFDLGFHISIISNGYLIDENQLMWLQKRKPDFIKITLYGASDETYKKVCGIDQGFSRVTSNIRKIREKDIMVVTCMTVIEDNSEDIEKVKGWAESENLKFVYSKVIRKKNGNARSNPESVRLPFVYDSSLESTDVPHTTDLFPRRNDSPFENCIGYHNACIISWNGIVHGCNFINTITVDIKGRAFLDCFKELWAKLDMIRRPKQCVDCKYLRFCNPCPGKLEGESGDPETISEYVCNLAKWCYFNENLLTPGSMPTADESCD